MKLSELSAFNKKPKKRVGRGIGSGHGKTSCRGHKGQKARSGGTIPAAFEGGQTPLIRRLPKRGFTNLFKKSYAVVNVGMFESLDNGTVVDEEFLAGHGLVSKGKECKILGSGNLSKAITLRVKNVSQGARDKIEKAGGKVETPGE